METKEKKEVKVYITNAGEVYSENDLKRYEVPASQQLDPITFRGLQVIEPPYDLAKLMMWMEMCVPHAAAINTKVQDSVGIGYKLVKDDDDDTKEDEAGKKAAMAFFEAVNDTEDIIRLSKKVYIDLEGCGNGYIEVARDAKGKIAALYQIPAPTMRLHSTKKLYVQRIAGRTVWFKKFGSEDVVNNKTGAIGVLQDVADMANEIIHLKQYTWRSPFYGLPEWLPGIAPMFAEQKEKEYNLNFFSSFGIPAYAVILKGMDYNKEVEDSIKKYFQTEMKANPHSTMVFATPAGGEIIFEKLNVDRKEASFRVYRRDNRDDILTAHRVPPYRAGIVAQGQLAGGVAAETDRIYLTSVVNPRQMEYEWVLTKLIMEEGLGITGWNFEFEDLVVDEKLAKAQVHQIYLSTGVMSPNEVREDLGEEPYEGGDEYAGQGGGQLPPEGQQAAPAGPGEGKPGAGQGNAGKPETDAVAGDQASAQDSVGGDAAGPAKGKRIVLGKSRKWDEFVEEKARKRNRGYGKAIDATARQQEKALDKEFKRQGNALLKFFQENGVLAELHADAKASHPELFTKKKSRFYETVSKVSKKDMEKVEKSITGWQDKVKPESVAPILKEFAKRSGKIGGAAGLESLGVPGVKFDLKNDKIIKQLENRGEKITGDITQKTLEDFREILVTEFYEEGKGPLEVAKLIEDLFDDDYEGRAETIARTETAIAVSTVQHETYERNGVQEKRWVAFLDARTRESHEDAHHETLAKPIPMDEPFVLLDKDGNEDEMMHPSDENGSPENVINCRCYEEPVVTNVVGEDSAWMGE